MKYMGSKNRIAKHILPIILKDRKEGQWYVEPFVGGANMIDKVDGNNKVGADTNEYLIDLLNSLKEGWIPPKELSEYEYKNIRENKGDYPTQLVGYVGIVLSYGSKWFGGYMRGNDTKGEPRNYRLEGWNNTMSQVPNLKNVIFFLSDYRYLRIPPESIIYCDPPYENTTSYKDKFNHSEFWEWCREQKKKGHTIFISEYNAPDDFTCVWQKEVNSSLTKNTGAKKAVEKLFTL